MTGRRGGTTARGAAQGLTALFLAPPPGTAACPAPSLGNALALEDLGVGRLGLQASWAGDGVNQPPSRRLAARPARVGDGGSSAASAASAISSARPVLPASSCRARAMVETRTTKAA